MSPFLTAGQLNVKHPDSSAYQMVWLGRIAGMDSQPGTAFEPRPRIEGVQAMPGIILTLIAVLVTLSFAFYSGYAEGHDRAEKRGTAPVAHRSRASKERKSH